MWELQMESRGMTSILDKIWGLLQSKISSVLPSIWVGSVINCSRPRSLNISIKSFSSPLDVIASGHDNNNNNIQIYHP